MLEQRYMLYRVKDSGELKIIPAVTQEQRDPHGSYWMSRTIDELAEGSLESMESAKHLFDDKPPLFNDEPLGCPLHPKYQAVRKPTSTKKGCRCAHMWNAAHYVPYKICVTPGCGSSVGIFRDNYLCPRCSND